MRVEQQRWLEAEVERLGPLEAIVRDLAAQYPIAAGETSGDPYCTLCTGESVSEPVTHDDRCPHRRAVEWVMAHPGDPVENAQRLFGTRPPGSSRGSAEPGP